MLRNEWLRRARIKKFKQNAEVALYTMEVDDLCTDWFKTYFDGRYSWEEKLTIALDDNRPVYGFDIWYDGQIVYNQEFKYPIYLKAGDLLYIPLEDLEIEMP